MKSRFRSAVALGLSCIVLLFAYVVALDMYPKFWQGDGFYLRFLKQHSDKEWHDIWQQLWDLSDSVTVPRSIVDKYGGDIEAADKVIEHIASYAFWVDDNGTQGRYSFKSDRLDMRVSGIVYFQDAKGMQAEIDVLLPALFAVVSTENKLDTARNINNFLCANVVYDDTGSMEGQTLYSTLVDKRAICGGFARTFHVLALMAGIDSSIVVGYLSWDAFDSVRHAWNTYTIDDVTYMIDATVNATSMSDWAVNRVIDESYEINYFHPELHAEAIRLK